MQKCISAAGYKARVALLVAVGAMCRNHTHHVTEATSQNHRQTAIYAATSLYSQKELVFNYMLLLLLLLLLLQCATICISADSDCGQPCLV